MTLPRQRSRALRPDRSPTFAAQISCDRALHAEQRRMAVMALVSCAWLLGAALIGTPEALGYLAPPLALIALLALGRYPGARVLERRLRVRRATLTRRIHRRTPRRAAPALLPRGGDLLATGLAGRAPPGLG